MANDFIKIERNVATAVYAQQFLQFLTVLTDAYERGRHLREIMRHNFDGADFTDMEALFGVPAGQGQAVFTLVDGTIGSMEGTFQVDAAKVITEQVG